MKQRKKVNRGPSVSCAHSLLQLYRLYLQGEMQGAQALARRSGALRQAWEQHYLEREERHARFDVPTAAAVVVFLLLATLRLEQPLSLRETVVHELLAALALMLVVRRDAVSYQQWRNVVVMLVRLGMCSSSVMHKHAMLVLRAKPPSRPVLSLLGSLVRMLIGDHTSMLAFMGWGWPLGMISNTLVQLASFYLVAAQNHKLCDTPYLGGTADTIMHGPLAGTISSLLPVQGQPSEQAICQWYTAGVQFLSGVLPPCLFWACADIRAAVQHAARHGIPADDRLHHVYRFLHHHLCGAERPLYWLLLATAALQAAAAVVLCLHGGF